MPKIPTITEKAARQFTTMFSGLRALREALDDEARPVTPGWHHRHLRKAVKGHRTIEQWLAVNKSPADGVYFRRRLDELLKLANEVDGCLDRSIHPERYNPPAGSALAKLMGMMGATDGQRSAQWPDSNPLIAVAACDEFCDRLDEFFEYLRAVGGWFAAEVEKQLADKADAIVPGPRAWSQPMPLKYWAGIFGMSANTMTDWFKKGQVRAVKKGGRSWRVAVDDIPGE